MFINNVKIVHTFDQMQSKFVAGEANRGILLLLKVSPGHPGHPGPGFGKAGQDPVLSTLLSGQV